MHVRQTNLADIKRRVAVSSITQEQLALFLGIDPTAFSRIIRGLRPISTDLANRIHEALVLLERAERAAQEARERVIMEGAGDKS